MRHSHAPLMPITTLRRRFPQVHAAHKSLISLKSVLQAENVVRRGHKQVLRQGHNRIDKFETKYIKKYILQPLPQVQPSHHSHAIITLPRHRPHTAPTQPPHCSNAAPTLQQLALTPPARRSLAAPCRLHAATTTPPRRFHTAVTPPQCRSNTALTPTKAAPGQGLDVPRPESGPRSVC